MWLRSACAGLLRRNGCARRCPRVNGVVAPTGSGAIERGGIMQPFRFSALSCDNARGVIGFGNQIVEMP